MERGEFIALLAATRLASTPAVSLSSVAEGQAPSTVKTLVLTHLLAQIDQPSVREQIVHEIQQVFGGKVIWGEDLMRLTPAGARVSTIESKQD